MTLNKVLIAIGILLSTVLFVGNAVNGTYAYVFWNTNASAGTAVLTSVFIGIFLGWGIRGFLIERKKDTYSDEDF